MPAPTTIRRPSRPRVIASVKSGLDRQGSWRANCPGDGDDAQPQQAPAHPIFPSIGRPAFFQACQLPGTLLTSANPSCFRMLVAMLAR